MISSPKVDDQGTHRRLKWKLGQATSAYTDATGPNAALNALDLVLVTASRMVVEDHGSQIFGEAALPLVETQRQLETNAWLSQPDVQARPTEGIDGHDRGLAPAESQPAYVDAIRFRELAAAVGMAQQGAQAPPPNSVFSLLFLNPFRFGSHRRGHPGNPAVG